MTEDKIFSSQQAKFEAALSALNEGLQTKGRLKNYDKVQRKIGRLIQQYARVGSQYHIEVNASKTRPHTTPPTWFGNAMNRPSKKTERKEPTSFVPVNPSGRMSGVCAPTGCSMKSNKPFDRSKPNLGLRPIHHQLASRVKSHLFVYLSARLPCRAYPPNALKAIRPFTSDGKAFDSV